MRLLGATYIPTPFPRAKAHYRSDVADSPVGRGTYHFARRTVSITATELASRRSSAKHLHITCAGGEYIPSQHGWVWGLGRCARRPGRAHVRARVRSRGGYLHGDGVRARARQGILGVPKERAPKVCGRPPRCIYAYVHCACLALSAYAPAVLLSPTHARTTLIIRLGPKHT